MLELIEQALPSFLSLHTSIILRFNDAVAPSLRGSPGSGATSAKAEHKQMKADVEKTNDRIIARFNLCIIES